MSSNSEADVPTFDQLMWPTLCAIKALGVSREMVEQVTVDPNWFSEI
ncbi:MAG: hypothetical protein HQL35_13710 [Alphaproteobacteria bacterium]|nr:hypothetical protein [Alphaproteobacteria bacterium]